MKNIKLFFIIIVVLTFLVACDSNIDYKIDKQSLSEYINSDINSKTENKVSNSNKITRDQIVGSWSDQTAESIGYGERFAFFKDGTFYKYTAQLGTQKEGNVCFTIGKWYLNEENLVLEENTSIEYNVNLKKYVKKDSDSMTKKIEIKVNPIEKDDSKNPPFSEKSKFGANYYYKYSSDPTLWKDEVLKAVKDVENM